MMNAIKYLASIALLSGFIIGTTNAATVNVVDELELTAPFQIVDYSNTILLADAASPLAVNEWIGLTVSTGGLFTITTADQSAPVDSGLDLAIYDATSGALLTWTLGSLIDSATNVVGANPLELTLLAGDYLLKLTGNLFADLSDGSSPDVVLYGIRVAAIPVPAAIWLFGSAMIGMFGFTRRRKITAGALAA